MVRGVGPTPHSPAVSVRSNRLATPARPLRDKDHPRHVEPRGGHLVWAALPGARSSQRAAAGPAGGPPILVAGSGEVRLLRLVAKYADMCNLSFPSGDSLDALPHTLEVLARHCQAVGRDGSEIRFTYKGVFALGDS